MRVLEAVIRLQCLFKPGEPVADLHVVRLAVGDEVGQNVAMVDVREFRQKFRGFLRPNHMSGGDPFAEIISVGQNDRQRDFVPVHGDSKL